jgi:5-methylcytosine-specific restriction endonuclease McrA
MKARREVETRANVSRLLTQGMSQAAIARTLGVTNSTVSYHARRLGHPVDVRCARRYDWQQIQRFGFSRQTWHAAVQRGAVKPRPVAAPIELYLVKGRDTCRTHLKRRLLGEGLKVNRCEACGLTQWRGQPLSMALHHLNGDGRDNRLENLQLLCPNCHAQTDNYSGKGRRRLTVVA